MCPPLFVGCSGTGQLLTSHYPLATLKLSMWWVPESLRKNLPKAVGIPERVWRRRRSPDTWWSVEVRYMTKYWNPYVLLDMSGNTSLRAGFIHKLLEDKLLN